MTQEEIVVAINSVYQRLNEVEQKLESFLLSKHEDNAEGIAGAEDAIVELAEVVAGLHVDAESDESEEEV